MHARFSTSLRTLVASRWFYRLACAAVLVWYLYWVLRGVAGPWLFGHDGFNGAAFSLAAKNSLRFELVPQYQYYMGLEPPNELAYTHHPLLLHAHLVGLFALLGSSEWVARLVPALYSIGILAMIYGTVRAFSDRWTALGAAALWALTPLHLVFANMVNHEQGSIFWLLVFAHCYARFVTSRAQPRRYLLGAMAALTLAVQFDWPGYYVAFFVFLHSLFVAHSGLPAEWRRRYLFSGVLAGVTLINFFGFFAWIYASFGSLEDMFASFSKRSSGATSSWWRLLSREMDVHGALLLTLLSVFAVLFVSRLARKRPFQPLAWTTFFFLAAQLIHSAVFRHAGDVHVYWTYHAGPAIAIGGALVMREAVREAEGSRWRYPVWVALAVLLSVQAVSAHTQTQRGVSQGRFSYHVEPPRYLDVQFIRSLVQRYPRGTVQWHVHTTAWRRIESRYYYDAPVIRTTSLEPPPGQAVLVVDLEGLAANERQRFAHSLQRYNVVVYGRRFVALSRGVPGLEAFEARAVDRTWLSRWLAYPDVDPIQWRPLGQAEAARILRQLGQGADNAHETWIGGSPGGQLQVQKCRSSWPMVGFEVAVAATAAGHVVNVRIGCWTGHEAMFGGWMSQVSSGSKRRRFTSECAGGTAIGVYGSLSGYVDSLGVICREVGGVEYDGQAAGSQRRQVFRRTCPAPSALVGVRIRAGTRIDALSLVCE